MSEDMKKTFEETMNSDDFKKEIEKELSGSDWTFPWFVVLVLLFAFPFGGTNSVHYDKQEISYLKGKVEAYEKILEV